MKTGLKRFLGIICLLVFLATASAESSDSRCPCQPKPPNSNKAFEKTYLKSSDVEIGENKILVRIEDKIIPAIALFSDDQGIYVLVRKRQGRCPEDYWECDTCSGCTPWYHPECDWCGYD
ncbi:MAG: hypothetical protein WA347_07855 [Rhabdochlamydiaceae bacterium]|jgi:hypothetical protein